MDFSNFLIVFYEQVGELAGIAVGASVMLNILVAGYVHIKRFLN